MKFVRLALCCMVFFPVGTYFAVEKLGLPDALGLGMGTLFAGTMFWLTEGFFFSMKTRTAGKDGCHSCGTRLPLVAWEEEFTVRERLKIESYVDVERAYACRQCDARYCDECAIKAKFCCQTCGAFGFRTGYSGHVE